MEIFFINVPQKKYLLNWNYHHPSLINMCLHSKEQKNKTFKYISKVNLEAFGQVFSAVRDVFFS